MERQTYEPTIEPGPDGQTAMWNAHSTDMVGPKTEKGDWTIIA